MAIAARIWNLVRGHRRLGTCPVCLEPVVGDDAVAGPGGDYLHGACFEARRQRGRHRRFARRPHLALARDPVRYTGD